MTLNPELAACRRGSGKLMYFSGLLYVGIWRIHENLEEVLATATRTRFVVGFN